MTTDLSFPRRREPRALKHFWIPACAGMTTDLSFPRRREPRKELETLLDPRLRGDDISQRFPSHLA